MSAAVYHIPARDIDLRATFTCGQTFRWVQAGGPAEAAPHLAGEGGAARGPTDRPFFGIAGEAVYQVRRLAGGLAVRVDPPVSRAAVEGYFRLDDPYSRILRRIGEDPVIRPAVRAHRGLRLLRQDPEELTLSFLFSPMSNIPRITRTLHVLARRFGHPIEFGGATFWRLPRLREMGRIRESDLRAIGAGFRARNIAALLRVVERERIDLGALRGRPIDEVHEVLCELPGIGPKVADCIALFSLDCLEAFPIDVWIRRVVIRRYLGGRRVTDRKIQSWAVATFGKDAGYAQQFLYHEARRVLPRGDRGLGRRATDRDRPSGASGALLK